MGTILQMTFANIRRKKFRTILITLSIVLSVALLYTVMSMSSTITNVFEQKIKKEVGNSQFMLLPKETSADQYLTSLSFTNINNMSYHIPQVTAFGYSEFDKDTLPVMLTGMDYTDYQTIYPMEYKSRFNSADTGYQVVIGDQTASKYDLSVGENITVNILGKPYEFAISGIIEDQNNNLSYELGSIKLLISRQDLSDILQLKDKASTYFIKGKSSSNLTTLKSDLEKAFPDLQVKDVTDMSDYKQMISMIVTCLLFMVLAVIMVSTFIIHSSFKIIVIERMPFIGTLRSLGATRKSTNLILLLEAVFYGLIGGLLGNGLGIIILSATLNIMFQNFGVTIENVSYFNLVYLLISLLIGLILVVGSAISPIIKTGKKSIKSVIFAEIHNEKHSSILKTIIGAILIGAAFVLFTTAPLSLQLPFNMLGVMLVAIGGALMIPFISLLLSMLLSLLFRPFFKDSFDITATNIKNDRTMMNNILLLAMGLGVILMINNFSSTVSVAVVDVYASGKADALAFSNVDNAFLQEVKKLDAIEHVYAAKETTKVPVNDGEFVLPLLEGIDGQNFCNYAWNEFGSYMTDDIIKEFTESRSIILSRFMAKKFMLKIGDQLKLDFNGNLQTYKVIEIVPSIMNNGNQCYVYDKFLAEDAGIENYQSFFVNIKDGADTKRVLQQIKELAPNVILPIQTLSEMQEENVKSNNALFFMMKAISLIAMFIGIAGILNNFTISFLSRRKLIATMRSLGLSKNKTFRMMLFEAFICGILGTVSGLLLGTLLLKAMCYMIEAIGLPSEIMFYNYQDYIFVLISGIILSIVSAILPALSIAKENIIAALKYE